MHGHLSGSHYLVVLLFNYVDPSLKVDNCDAYIFDSKSNVLNCGN